MSRTRLCPTLIVIALLIVIEPSVQAIDMLVTTIDGQEVAGELSLWQSGKIVIKQGEDNRTFDANNVLEVRPVEKPKATAQAELQIQLADGSRFPFSDLIVTGRVAEIKTPLSAEPLKIAAGLLSHVTFEKADSEWPTDTTSDFLIVKKKDSEETEILFGVINEINADQVEFNWDGDVVPVKRTKLAGLGFYQADNENTAEPLCWLNTSGGAKLAARGVDRDGDNFTITLAEDVKLRVPLSEIESADFSVGKLSYLSDMSPLVKKWTPLVSLPAAAETIQNFGEPRQNMSFSGSQLSLQWPARESSGGRVETYSKGLAIRSRTELEYRIPKTMRRFVALVGIDPETVRQGHVALKIEVDGESVFDETIAGDQAPREVDLDVTGKQRLRIFVDYGENLDLGDRLHLVEARLIK